VLRTTAIAFALCCAAKLLGPLAPPTYRLLASVALLAPLIWLLVQAARCAYHRAGRARLLAGAAAAVALTISLVSFSVAFHHPEAGLASVVLIAIGFSAADLLLFGRTDPTSALLAAGFTLFRLAEMLIPEVSAGLIDLSLTITSAVDATWHGPTTAGLWLTVLGWCAAVALAWRPDGRQRALALALVSGLLLLLFPHLQEPLGEAAVDVTHGLAAGAGHVHVHADPGTIRGLALACWALLHIALIAAMTGRGTALSPRRPGKRWIAVAGLAAAAMIATATSGGSRGAVPSRAVVGFIGQPGLAGAWSRPHVERLGLRSLGMFGELPVHLGNLGFGSRLLPPRPSSHDLADIDVLVVINPEVELDADSLDAVWSHVRRGGGLVVLGDHTDILGTMRPLNRLLEPTGIRFRFDTALGFTKAWIDGVEVAPHPVTRGVAHHQDLQLGAGASLAIDRRATPILFGRYGHSDWGDYSNDTRDERRGRKGGYLGNYVPEPGERTGDLVLAAAARMGAGRVLVFGDTTYFQNPVLPYTWQLANNSITYAAGGTPPSRPLRLLAILALLGALSLALTRLAVGNLTGVALATVAIGFAAGVISLTRAGDDQPIATHREHPIAIVDLAHGNDVNRMLFTDDSLGSLIANLQRSGYMTVVTRGQVDLSRTSLYVLPAPLATISASHRRRLIRFVREGGAVMVAVGLDHAPAVGELLRSFGAAIAPAPVGSLDRAVERPDEPRLPGAWKLALSSDWEPIRTQYAAPVAAVRQYGAGRVLLVGDATFVLDQNLEQEDRHHRANVDLLLEWLQLLKGPDHAAD
jgi:hypothetical protein